MIPKELLKKIRRVQIRTSHLANDVLAGQYHSAFRGQGVEFEEVREYTPGDDIRTIDWNVTARVGRPFIKRFREERELTVMLLADISGSIGFGTAGQRKRDLLAEVGATLAFSAIRNNDKVGLIGFSDRVEKFVKPDKGTRHVLRVIRELLTLETTGKGTRIAEAIDHLNRVVRRRSVVFIISDFQDTGFDTAMRMARRRHDLIPIVITDPREMQIPKVRYIELQDSETGERELLDTSSARFRREFARRARVQAEARQRLFRSMRADSIELTTGEPFFDPVTRFFRARRARQ